MKNIIPDLELRLKINQRLKQWERALKPLKIWKIIVEEYENLRIHFFAIDENGVTEYKEN